jgi:1-acyl-sn-glycerol-3-phosphate acyltransferase
MTAPSSFSLRNGADGLYCLIATPVFCVVMFGLFCPLILISPTLTLRRAIGRVAVHVCLALIGQRLRREAMAWLPDTPTMVVSNHASYMDGLILTAVLPSRFTFVVQDGAARWPFVGQVLRRMGVSFINRTSAREGAQQTRLLMKRMKAGESLAIFAEGTFDDSGPGLLPFKTGAFLLAARAGVPVVPVAIRNSREMLGAGWMGFRWRPVSVIIGPPSLPFGNDRAAVEALKQQARRWISAHCGEPDRQLDIATSAQD